MTRKRIGNVTRTDSMGDREVLDLDGAGLTVGAIAAAGRREVTVELGEVGLRQAAASQLFADRAAQRRPLYGRSTGVGANRSVLITVAPSTHALMLLRSHATSAGEARSAERVRAMLVVRLNQLATGGSGVDPSVLSGLLGMIRADALPDVRELGSIGTGDLSALATTALALMGEGATGAPLGAASSFGAADGLAFISSNAATLADAALAVASLRESARAALVIAALTFHAVGGNAEAYSGGAMLTTPFPGARAVCDVLRDLLGADPTGDRTDASGNPIPPARIQDPFGLRALPQVHGPVLDQITAAVAVIEALVNAPTENPLVRADGGNGDSGTVAHHAGFHQAYLQMALDTLGLAVAQSGQLVMARVATLVEPNFTGLAPFLGDGTPGASGVMVCEYVAASALGSIRGAAAPAGLQTVTLSRGVEEDASFASLAATQCLLIAERYRTLLACELVAAVRAVRMQNGTGQGEQRRAAAGRIGQVLALCAELPSDVADRDLTNDLAAAVELLPALAGLVS
ncbi:histidine ammonia-lyase [Nakamurella sp. UYEF19]|uniref:aromatic amino acid lyase n=1 Tax=Nakamurella sp. UYEF19 TaxID=1756392 RepID=UPI0033977DA6